MCSLERLAANTDSFSWVLTCAQCYLDVGHKWHCSSYTVARHCFLRFHVFYFTDFDHHFHVPLLAALKPSHDFAASPALQRQIVEPKGRRFLRNLSGLIRPKMTIILHNDPILCSFFPLSFHKPRLVWPGRSLLQSLQLFHNGSVALKPEWARWKAFMAAGK